MPNPWTHPLISRNREQDTDLDGPFRFRALWMLPVALATLIACSNEPTGTTDDFPTAVAAGALEGGSDQLVMTVSDRMLLDHEFEHRVELSVERFTDGVGITLLDPPPGSVPAVRASDGDLAQQAGPPARGLLTLSGGMALFDRGDDRIDRGDPEALRELFPFHVSRPAGRRDPLVFPTSTASGSWRETPRRGRTVTAERSEQDLADLRRRADVEEAAGPQRLRFRRARDGASEAWVFDTSVGAVIEHVVDPPEGPRIRVRFMYERLPGAYAQAGSVTEWISDDGDVLRRVERSYAAS